MRVKQCCFGGILLLGTSIRVCLFQTGLHDLLLDYPDYTTPVSSIRNVKEALHLVSIGHSPYDGDIFHGSPLLLLLFRHLHLLPLPFPAASASTPLLQTIFILIDICIGLFLYAATESFTRLESAANEEEFELLEQHAMGVAARRYVSASLGKVDFRNDLSLKSGGLRAEFLPLTVFGFFYLNPFTVLGCVAMNTNAIAQCVTAAAILAACERRPAVAAGLVALAAAFQPFNAMLIVPTGLLGKGTKNGMLDGWLAFGGFVGVGVLLLWMAAEEVEMEVVDVVYHAHWRMCSVPDLRPNVGVWWYFFTETFERFQDYFLLIFNAHPYVYIAPLSLNLAHRPIFLAQILYCIFSIFVPYPDMPGIAFALCMLIMHPLSLIRVKGLFVLLVGIAVPSFLMPLMWHMWIYAGTGNANFYYFQNLIFLMSVCLLVAQVLKATVQRDRLLKAFRKRKRA